MKLEHNVGIIILVILELMVKEYRRRQHQSSSAGNYTITLMTLEITIRLQNYVFFKYIEGLSYDSPFFYIHKINIMKKLYFNTVFLVNLLPNNKRCRVYKSKSFEETTSITITINGSTVDEAAGGNYGSFLYLWAWSYDTNDANSRDCPMAHGQVLMKQINLHIQPELIFTDLIFTQLFL
jgi:hypothetical protein